MINGKFTTSEAAEQARISLATINRWIDAKKIEAPEPTLVGAVGKRARNEKNKPSGTRRCLNTERAPDHHHLTGRQRWVH